MALTTRFVSEDLYVAFNGTDISTNVKMVTLSQSLNLIEASSAGDANNVYISGRIDDTWTIQVFRTSGGTAATGDQGSVIYVGAEGTIVVGEQGTAAGLPKWEFPCVIESNTSEFSRENPVMLDLSARLAGAYIANYYTNGSVFP